MAICMVRRALSSIGTREGRKIEKRTIQETRTANEEGKQRKKENKGEEERGAHRDP